MITRVVFLQTGSYSWVLMFVASLGALVFLLVVYFRIRQLLHAPRIIGTKPASGPPVQTPAPIPSGSPPAGSPTGTPHAMGLDSGELLQAKSRWEDLIMEAQTNESLTEEQRQSIVEEARKRITEIDRSLAIS